MRSTSGCSSSSPWPFCGISSSPKPDDAEHVEDEHAVVRDDGAAALRDDRRMLHAGVVAHASGCGRRRRWRIPRACSSRSTRSWSASRRSRRRGRRRRRGTRRPGAGLDQLRVDARRFVQRALDDADVGNLAAEVEVQELEAVLHAVATSAPRGPGGLRRPSGRTSTGSRPTTASARRRATASLTRMPMLRPHADLARVLEDQPELGVLLDDRDDACGPSSGRASPSR